MSWLDKLLGRGKKDAGEMKSEGSMKSEGMGQGGMDAPPAASPQQPAPEGQDRPSGT